MIFMNTTYERGKASENLTVAEKLRLIRKANSVTQNELAEIILTSDSKISFAENNTNEYSEYEIETIKKHFNIVDMPLTDFERAAFRESLYCWRDMIRDGRMAEAEDLRGKLCDVVNLTPCDKDLPALFILFDVIFLLTKGNLEAAEENLAALPAALYDEHFYYFNLNMGSLNSLKGRYEDALDFYEAALKVVEDARDFVPSDKEVLYYNMAACYTQIEIPNRAIVFLNNIRDEHREKRITAFNLGLDIGLAANYIQVGNYRWAEEILNDCLVKARGIKGIYGELYVGLTLLRLGVLYRRTEEWEKSINFLEQALNHFEVNTEVYRWTLYLKIRCVIEAKEYTKAGKSIKQAKGLYKNNEEHLVLFESLVHIMAISKSMTRVQEEAIEYIENVTIPYLINARDSIEAISCYKLLQRHCAKIGRLRKSIAFTEDICNIYERMFVSHERGKIS